MNIAVAGMGYVGLSLAVLLARHNDVTAVDVINEKVEMVNNGISPVDDRELTEFLHSGTLSLSATTDAPSAYEKADMVIVSTPTDYDSVKGHFNTSSVEAVVEMVTEINPDALIIIKSTVPVGFTEEIRERTGNGNIIFSPEFLREGHALYDNLHPSRIVVGVDKTDGELVKKAERFIALLKQGADDENTDTLVIGLSEAESVKLFANTYLALRVAFFNELDTYAEMKGLDTGSIIEGVCLDPRIGSFYNNPSFGYGGYCLPKDTKQLLANYENVPENLIRSIVESNRTRKNYITERIIELAEANGNEDCHPVIGIYKLAMKSGSDNHRNSSILGIIKRLRGEGIDVVIYDPSVTENVIFGNTVEKDLEHFKQMSTVIVANRFEEALEDVKDKVYTRDLFSRD